MSFRAVRRTLVSSNGAVLALDERRAGILVNLGARIARGARVTNEDLAAACGGGSPSAVEMEAQRLAQPVFVQTARDAYTAVVSFRGLVNYDVDFQPYAVSTRLFARTLREFAADGRIKSVIVVFSSPGGEVTGVPEAADALFAARQAKKVTAVVDTMAASAAYWIASQCSEIVCLPSGWGVGSIGVRMMHVECSAMLEADGVKATHIFSGQFKTEGNMTEPLTAAARARYQLECDTIYGDFIKAVARGRQVTSDVVRESFGKGRLLMPAEAKRLGMLDRLEETDDSFRRLGLISSGTARRQASLDQKSLGQIFLEGIGQGPETKSKAVAQLEECRRQIAELERDP